LRKELLRLGKRALFLPEDYAIAPGLNSQKNRRARNREHDGNH